MSLSELKNSLDDKVWEIYSKGLTCTVNQVDSDFGTNICKRYKPKSIEDIAKICAAIRPSFNAWREQFLSRKPYSNGNKKMDELLKYTDNYILFQENVMQYFEWLGVSPAESIGLIKKISKKKIHPEDFKNLENRIKDGWVKQCGSLDGFQENWDMIQGCIAYSFNCVAGSTYIYRGFTNNRKPLTVEEIYFTKNNREWAKENHHIDLYKKYRTYGYGTAISMEDDYKLRKNEILDIYYAGYKDVYRVTTETGKFIVCTINHKFPTIKGELELSELSIGDYLYCKQPYVKPTNGGWLTDGNYENNYPSKGQCGFRKKPNCPTSIYIGTRTMHQQNKDCCEMCGAPYNIRFELHHKDFDHTHNTPDNLMWLCNNCHKKIHYAGGRTKVFERGLDTKLEKIISIEYAGKENVYNISMGHPYHNYVVNDGIVTSNSPHALGYAYDSLYCAYLKSHYPLEYYSVVLNIYKNDEVRTAKLTKELEYFKIKLKNPKFRYSKSDYYFDEDTKTIYKGIGSIKYLNEEVSNSLYELRDRKYNSFIELLYDLKDIDIDSRQLEILIKLDYFSEFGNSKELLRLVLFFNFFKKGEMKSVSKEKLESSDAIRTIVAQHSTETPKKYKDLDNKEILKEVEEYVRSLNIEDFGFKDKIQSQLEYTGYISLITGKKEDKPKEVALNVKTMYSKDGDRKPWAVVIQGQSIGSGIKNDFTIPYNKFSHHPFSKYDIIHIKKFHKSPKGYWYIDSYEVLI